MPVSSHEINLARQNSRFPYVNTAKDNLRNRTDDNRTGSNYGFSEYHCHNDGAMHSNFDMVDTDHYSSFSSSCSPI